MNIKRINEGPSQWSMSWINLWPNPFDLRRYNWINFEVIRLGFEWGKIEGIYLEVTLIVMGLGINIDWHDRTSRSVFLADMDQRVAEAKDAMGLRDEE